ncbi:MAG: hypothetical protein RML72_04760 [Bacteroidia bacterium]|nr:hypothetical protein [Bacteroidia bacterium]MDW8158174.1 hypothetical protein [Bacteroidia bacterium]
MITLNNNTLHFNAKSLLVRKLVWRGQFLLFSGFLIWSFALSHTCAQVPDIPFRVKAKLNQLHPNAQNVSWRMPQSYQYEAFFTASQVPAIVCFDSLANIVAQGIAIDMEQASDELKDNLVLEIQEQMKEHATEDVEVNIFIVLSPGKDTLYYLDISNELEIDRTILDKRGRELKNYEVTIVQENDTLSAIHAPADTPEPEPEEQEKDRDIEKEIEEDDEEDDEKEEEPLDD